MFWKKFLELCANNNTKPTSVALALNVSRGSVTNWKKGVIPQDTTLKKIADYFGVSVECFKGETERAQDESEVIDLDQRKMRMVPLFETASAGFGAYASEDIQDYMPVYFHNPSEAAQTICIKVRGDSMYPKIENGDIIQVHKQDSVDSGSIAVVLLDGDEGLVKVVEYGSDWIELLSINPMYPPMRFDRAETEKIRVVGLVTQVIKGINGRKPNFIKISDNKKELLDNIDKMDADELREFNRIYNEYLKKKEN
jgi:SOS-response transcriptional repressor LexA